MKINLRVLGLLCGILIGTVSALAVVKPAFAGYDISCWSRSQARDYAYTLFYEGYQYNGGWWNNNNAIDSGEGPDCSGSTFKIWAMNSTEGSSDHWYWYIGDNVHGPYQAWEFRDGCYDASHTNTACYDVCGSGSASCDVGSYPSTDYMDAFAEANHVAVIYSEGINGFDIVIDTIGNPTGAYYQHSTDYRLQSNYDGVRRRNWFSYCPQ